MQLSKYKNREKHSINDQTLQSRMSALRRFKKEAEVEGEPDAEDVEDWIDHLIELHSNDEIKASTIKQYYKSVKYYFQKVVGDDDPIEHIHDWLPDNDVDHGEYLDNEEWEALISNAYSAREDAFITVMYQYARRPGEVLLLNKDDVVFSEDVEDDDLGTITFPILKKRKVFRATFELTEESEDKLKDYLKYRTPQEVTGTKEWEDETVEPLFTTGHGRMSYGTVRKNIKTISNRAGIEKNITPKSMRHSRATHLDWEGNSPGEIARQQLIHDPDTDVIGAYIHDRDEEQVRTVMSTDAESES